MGAPSETSSERIAPGVRIGSYLIERSLGGGGMGAVHAGRHVGLDKPVVIKTLHPTLSSKEESVRRFVREGRAASKIRHPHVVDVTDVGTHEGVPYLVMEYLEGEDLHSRLDACGRLTPAEIARIMLPVLDALAYAHEAGVIHRDLKPSNIFLARGPHGEEPKILDFGIAKIVDNHSFDADTITLAASYLGTPYYSSPEQAQSGRNADARSDQYSIGAIMYELATGQHGLPGETPFEVLSAIVARKRARITDVGGAVDPALVEVIERAMAYDPADRFPTIRHLGHALLPLAPADVAQRWGAAFHVGHDSADTSGVGFAETMNSGPQVVGPGSEPSPGPAFTPPGSIPGVPAPPRPSSVPPAAPLGPERASSAPGPASHPPSSRPPPSYASAPPAAAPAEGGSTGMVVFAAVAGLVVAGGVAAGIWYSQTRRAHPTPETVASPPPEDPAPEESSELGVGGEVERTEQPAEPDPSQAPSQRTATEEPPGEAEAPEGSEAGDDSEPTEGVEPGEEGGADAPDPDAPWWDSSGRRASRARGAGRSRTPSSSSGSRRKGGTSTPRPAPASSPPRVGANDARIAR